MDGSLNPDGRGSSVMMWASRDLPSPVWIDAEWVLVASISLKIEAQSVVQTELVAAGAVLGPKAGFAVASLWLSCGLAMP